MWLIDADKLLEMIKENIEESGNLRMAVLAEEVIDIINDYAEDYESEADYQRGLDDAWRIIQKVFRYVEDGGMPLKELEKAFGTGDLGKIVNLSVEEAMSKLRTYEAKKKAEEEIKVGDEVETDYNGNVIIAGKPKDGWYVTIAKNFARYSIHESHIIKKTGRHFPQVAELLEAMKEDGET